MAFLEIEYRKRDREWNMASMQSHGYYEIYYLLSGKRSIFTEDKLFVIDGGSLVVIPPFCMHRTEGGPYERINIYIDPSLLDEGERSFLQGFRENPAIRLTGEGSQRLRALFDSYIALGGERDISVRGRYQLHFAKLALLLMQTAARSPILSSELKLAGGSEGDLALSVVSYINSNLRGEITLEGLCRSFFVSKNTLCRRFREAMGCSVMEYCSVARLNEAKRHLLATDKSVEEIAELCGFSSANYFSLIFKRKIGISPLNYRKKK